jgi:hypothetical protein
MRGSHKVRGSYEVRSVGMSAKHEDSVDRTEYEDSRDSMKQKNNKI